MTLRASPFDSQEGILRTMQDPAVQACPHGLRPGTTVCLHCRADARLAARQRRYRFLARVGLITLGGGAVAALIIGGLMSLAPGGSPGAGEAGATSTVVSSAGNPETDAAIAPPAAAGLRPLIPEGRRELGDSMYAVRDGAQITVHFDTELLRTRFDWKFEGVVRATLPLVYGDAIRNELDSIPSGSLVRGGDLLTDLPTLGIPIAVGDERLRVWPITRPGRDGPLVVGYRVSTGR